MSSEFDIEVITDPNVYVVARQTIDEAQLQGFLDDHNIAWETDTAVAAEVLTESAGRMCYMSYAAPRPGGNRSYLQHIKEAAHGSVFEHAVWSFMINGVSRSLSHEFVRHRAGFAYSQLSQRYVDESDGAYVEPDIIAADPELHEIWLEAVEHAHRAYMRLAEKLSEKLSDPKTATAAMLPLDADRTTRRKTARQAARSVLPNATETKLTITANARALRHFLEQRGSVFAEPEIRKLANRILDILQLEAPNLFGDYQKIPLPDGTFDIQTPYRKV